MGRAPFSRPNQGLHHIGTSDLKTGGVSIVSQRVKNLSSIYEDAGLIPGLALWVKEPALP